jgi:uncharacterized protein (TIGR00661 family)
VLQGAGHRLKVVTYGQSVDQLADYDLIPIRGISHRYDRRGRFSLLRSVFWNLGVLGYHARGWQRLRRQLAEFSPDVAIVNFEPFVPLLARSLKIPVISFDNQHALLRFRLTAPAGWRRSAWFTKTAIGFVARQAEHYVIMAFVSAARDDGRVHVVPPAVQNEIRRIRPSIGSHVLVYLKHPSPPFLEVLRQTGEQFLVYGCNRAGRDGNLTFRVFNNRMHDELGSCKAVMGTTGMSLLSEAVWLKKPFFGIPLPNEYEQRWNASVLRRANFGDFSERPTKEAVGGFFHRLDDYRRSLDDYRFDPDAAGRKLLELVERQPERRSGGLAAREPGLSSPGFDLA